MGASPMLTTTSQDSAPDKMLPTAPLPRYRGHLALMDGQGPASREWQAGDHNGAPPSQSELMAGPPSRLGASWPIRRGARVVLGEVSRGSPSIRRDIQAPPCAE